MGGLAGGLADNGGLSGARVPLIAAQDYGVRADGTDQATNLQTFQNALRDAGPGARGILPPGRIVTSGTLIMDSKVWIEGQGRAATEIFLADSSNVDLVQSRGLGVAPATGSGGGGPSNWGLANLSLNGNARTTDGQSPTATKNTAGNGIKAFARAFTLEHLKILNCAQVGVDTSWYEGAFDPANIYWQNNYLDSDEESRHFDIYIERCFGGGILEAGPHDSVWTVGHVVKCGADSPGPYTTAGIETSAAAGSTSTSFVMFHSWGSNMLYTWKLGASSTHLIGCQADGPRALVLGSGVTWHAGVFGSSPDGIGLEIGSVATGVGDFSLTGKFTREGILLTHDFGNNRIDVECYWPDPTQQFFTGTAYANKASKYDVDLRGDSPVLIAADGIDVAAPGKTLIGGIVRRKATRQVADSRAASQAHLPTGYKGQTSSRLSCGGTLNISGGQLTSGTLIASGPIWLPDRDTVSAITLVAGANAMSGIDHLFCALLNYNGSGWDVLAKTGDTAGDRTTGWVSQHRDFAIAQVLPTFSGATTNGSAVVTGITSTFGLSAADPIQGTGVPAATTILSVDSGTQITMSANATATGTPTITAIHTATQYVAPTTGIKVWVAMIAQGATSPVISVTGITSASGLPAGYNDIEPVSIFGPGSLTTPASLVTPLSSTSLSSKFLWAALK